jgi:hypothetical protein
VNRLGFPEENIAVLSDSQATLTNIKNAIGKLGAIDSSSRVLFFFAGHGETVPLRRGGEMGLLVPYDARAENQGTLFASCLQMTDVRGMSTFVPARHMLFLVDACYGGLAAATRSIEPEPEAGSFEAYIGKLISHRAREIITGGGKGERVIESPDWGHSAFTMSLLEGLGSGFADTRGERIVTSLQLSEYLKRRVSAYSRNRQTPVYSNLEPESDEGQFVFRLVSLAPPMPVRFTTNVDSANLFIDNKSVGFTRGDSLTMLVKHGKHTVVASRDGFKSDRQVIEIAERPKDIQLSLAPILGQLEVYSDPPGAMVLIDGNTAGRAPMTVKNIPYGKHSLMFVLLDHGEKTVSFEVKGEATQSLGAHLVSTPEYIARGLFRDRSSAKTTWTYVGGVLTLGMGITTYALNSSANGLYGEYKSATDVNVMNAKYNDYTAQVKMRNIAAGGIGLFALFTLYELIRGVSYDDALRDAQSERVSLKMVPGVESVGISASLRF